MKINIHIERLTVEGQSQADGVRVGEALRSRLAALAASGVLGQPHAFHAEHLDAGELAPGATSTQTGHHLAGQIFQNLKGPRHG